MGRQELVEHLKNVLLWKELSVDELREECMQRSLSWRAEAERQERQELQERLAMACCAKAALPLLGPRMVRYYIRVCLFFPLPAYGALFWTDSILLMLLACSALLAVPLHFLWMRKRLGPFLAFLSCVYAAQMALCLCMAHFRLASHHTAEAVKPDAPIQTISVVMTAHNEQQYLKRTLDSIIETTPAEVLVEIILIDDGSQPPLEVSGYDQVQLRRHERRGLVKSKMEGGNMARGDMIMFLDAHVKPTKGWYKPILRHVNINYKRVVVPLIPILDGDSWQINNLAVGVKMMFDWQLRFKWLDDGSDLVPCMSGGLFGITKRWWHESGEYDYGMNMWGGENIEQSIRIWLCGGEIFVARDSRIGHVFRKEFPYEINSTEIMINKVRAVETWFDDYKAYFYHAEPNAARLLPAMGSIEERLALKDRLQCKPFHWFVHKFHQDFVCRPWTGIIWKRRHARRCLGSVSAGRAEMASRAWTRTFACKQNPAGARWAMLPSLAPARGGRLRPGSTPTGRSALAMHACRAKRKDLCS
ncbi:unnamed protein product [Effrenium voratum]|uniref:Glycosyltransferase 2-like domain-containing protein n=1 Tax=Effrenium voratum TaxID=2562239 RepID=A0AA36NHJ9_9DINO|nr:unnamed protein product [Effrenium voratum]